jgi:hypothetical protein
VDHTVVFATGKYSVGGGLVVQLLDSRTHEPYTTISVNFWPDVEDLPPDQFYGKSWSENEGILDQLVEQGAIELVTPRKHHNSGFVTSFVYKLLNP